MENPNKIYKFKTYEKNKNTNPAFPLNPSWSPEYASSMRESFALMKESLQQHPDIRKKVDHATFDNQKELILILDKAMDDNKRKRYFCRRCLTYFCYPWSNITHQSILQNNEIKEYLQVQLANEVGSHQPSLSIFINVTTRSTSSIFLGCFCPVNEPKSSEETWKQMISADLKSSDFSKVVSSKL